MITAGKFLRGIILLAIIPWQHLNAAVENVSALRIHSTFTSSVNVGASTTADFNPKTGPGIVNVQATDLITLGVDPHYPVFISDNMDVKVTLQITAWDQNNNLFVIQPAPQTLQVKYHPFDNLEYVDKVVYSFNNAYKYTVAITQIDVSRNGGAFVTENILPANLYIDAFISVERYYDFSAQSSIPIMFNAMDSIDLDCDGKYDELEISWQNTQGAEEYQLEWTFVNDYISATSFQPASNLNYDFRGNSTRITISSVYNSYRLPIIFDHGYLLFRVRAIGKVTTNPSQLIVGVWSVADQGTVNNVVSKYYVWSPHEGDKNWQVTTTFAEEGKKKEVISYFDGTLRNRQTVTKINTDKNTIVGETIYDHQGRPSVTVLPVPVPPPVCTNTVAPNESVIKFYPDFNLDDTTKEYSRNDFDMDGTDSCFSSFAPMSPTSGASNYYSDQNPNKQDFQAFVPDAKKFPFTQVEYTPDNTGRIRRQGGVGPEFQLDDGSGTKHETKYFYGQPNQLQLDRLFGSEMGDATHYKKNVVVDANSQHSVSYLDQEGRVIATSLAGDVPDNLEALPSELAAVKTFTVDAFAEDANGISKLNTVNVSQTGIDFTTQLLVTYQSDYKFKYDMEIDTVGFGCLTSGLCFQCVYDLEIKITDECGVNLLGGNPIAKKVGNFTPGPPIKFETNCSAFSSSPTYPKYTTAETFTIQNMKPGVYTVTKTLTIDTAARNFYVNAYLDTLINTDTNCLKPLSHFQKDALSKIDTSDCYIDCSDCIAALGLRDDFIAAGNGTGFDYDREYEECQEMCKTGITLCETSYRQMLSDVSPAGQYAQYLDTINNIVNPALYPLSVLNTGNVLPYGFTHSPHSDWRNPRVMLNNSLYLFYLEEDGTRSTIIVSPDLSQPSGFWPNVNNPNTNVLQDAQGINFTYPENLTNVKDFITAWKPSWAKSLVQYHPEYCYYETCKEYSIKQGTDKFTSDAFDSLLIVSESFNDAVTNKLIKQPTGPGFNYSAFPDPNDRLTDWFNNFNSPVTNPYDPFVTNSTAYGSYSTMLLSKFNQYFTNPASFTMLEAAAMTVRCGKLYGITPTATCMEFGTNLIPNPTNNAQIAALNDSIRDLEWHLLRGFYLSAKQQLQNDLADAEAIKSPCFSLNDCIGDKDYNPATAGMFSVKPPSPPPTGSPLININPWNKMPYFDRAQPCGVNSIHLYRNKFKRFPDKEDLPAVDANQIAYQMYLQTGQCANAFNLQQLLDAFAGKKKLEATNESLLNYGEYNALYLSKHHFTPQQPITSEGYSWNGTASGNLLNVQWKDPSNANATKCLLTFDKTGTGITNWNDIIGFKDLKAITANTYTVLAVLAGTSSFPSFIYKPISGTISCINIIDCFFAPVCSGNDFAKDIASLMSVLAASGDLTGSQVALSTSASYSVLITPRIKNMLGTPNNDMRWTYNSPQQQFIVSDPGNSQQITFTITAADPVTFSMSNLSQIKSFSDIRSNFQNSFKVNGLDANGNVLVTLTGNATKGSNLTSMGISMGECGNPTPFNCKEKEFEVRDDLEALLHEALLKKPFSSNIDLYSMSNFSSLLQSYVPQSNTTPPITASTEVQGNVNGTYYDSLLFIIPKCVPQPQLPCSDSNACRMNLWINNPDSNINFANITSLGQLIAKGTPDANGNFHDFCMIACYGTSSTSPNSALPSPVPVVCDTIFGTSCWPIKNCDPCVEIPADSALPCISGDWVQRFNSPDSLDEIAVAFDIHNCILVLGYKSESNSVTLVKYSPSGDQLWATNYPNMSVPNINAEAPILTVDDQCNPYIVGSVNGDFTTVKFDSAGNVVWVNSYDNGGFDMANAVDLDGQGNIYVTGLSTDSNNLNTYDIITLKLDQNGNRQWLTRYDGGGLDAGHQIAVDADKNSYVCGLVSTSTNSIVLIKYDSNGIQLWNRNYPDAFVSEIIEDSKGHIYLAGGTNNPFDYLLLRYDSDGNLLWTTTYNGDANSDDGINGIAIDSQGNSIVTGVSNGVSSSLDYTTIKYDTSGTLIWVQRYNGPANDADYGFDVALDQNDNVYVTGYSNGIGTAVDFATIKYRGSDGQQIWEERYNGPANSKDYGIGLAADADSNIYVFGQGPGIQTGYDIVTLKYSQHICPEEGGIGPLPVDTVPSDTVIIGQPRLRIPLDSASIAQQDSIELASGALVRNTDPLVYQTYDAEITATNTRLGLAATDPQALKAVSYIEYAEGGFAQFQPSLSRYITSYNPTFDNTAMLNSPAAFGRQYGYGTNVTLEYQRYVSVLNRYNQYATANGSGNTLAIISDSSFIQGCFADELPTYVRYVDSLMSAGDTTQAMDATSFFTARGIIDSLHPQDTCTAMYENYVEAWRIFKARQQQNNTCLNYQTLVPLYSCGDFKRNNLCCSNYGYTLFNQYIASLLDTTSCPGPLPKLDNCNALSPEEDIRNCERLYILYLSAIDQYSTSAYASATGFTLVNPYPTFSSFHRTERCKCAQAYLAYLETYLANPANLALPAPKDIDQWPGCQVPSPLPNDTCERMTRRFENAITRYNDFAIQSISAAALQPPSPSPAPIFPPIIVQPPSQDVLNRYCDCVTSIEATVDAIGRGTFDNNVYAGVGQLSIIRICNEFRPPCTPNHPPNDTLNMPALPYSSPCVEYMINTALLNAHQQWQHYMDSLTTVVSANYTQHCLGALENFVYEYEDKEYHFTLYYYDQAGNLVKTVPPEGVNPINILSSADPRELKIIADRTNGTRSIDGMTFHNLATTYLYNSLNQLVRQNMPDHDQMDIWETTLPNGLDSRLKITRTQFVNSSDGYLTGYIDQNVPFTRGYVYKTYDGGATWQKVTDLVAAGFNKVQFVSATVGYATGDHGIVMKTSDGGSSWDMLPTYATSISNSNINNTLLAVQFRNSNEGICAGANGLALRTTDGGNTFSQISIVPLPTTDVITSITDDGTNYYATIKRTLAGREFAVICTSSTGTTWTEHTSYRATDLLKIQYYGVSKAYAAGKDGNLLWTNDNGTTWYAIATGTTGKFKDLYFRNDNDGIAIIENASGAGEVWKTSNAGNTWTLLSAATEDYTSLRSYHADKIAAVGKSGMVRRVLMTAATPNPSMNIASMNIPSPPLATFDFTAVWASQLLPNNSVIIAGGSNSKIYMTRNGSVAANSVAWTTLTVPDSPVKKIEAVMHGNNNISGIVITNTGKLVYIFYDAASDVWTSGGLISPLNDFVDISIGSSGNIAYLYRQTDKRIYSVTLANSSTNPAINTVGSASPLTGIVQSISKNGNSILLTGDGGLIWKFDVSSPQFADQSENMKPLVLADIKISGTAGNMYAIGKDGTGLKQTVLGKWTLAETNTAENLNGIYFSSTSTGAIAGDNGSLFTFTIPTTGVAVNLTSLTTPTSENLNAIAGTSNTIYAAGNKGTLLFCQDITAPNVQAGVPTTVQDLRGVAILPNTTNAYAVGGKAHVRFCFGQSAFRIKEVFPHRLNGVHFSNPMNGFAVGDKYIVRYTTDGGTSWNLSLPVSVPTSNVPDLKTVFTKGIGTAFIGGSQKLFARVNNGLVTPITNATGNNTVTFHAIAFSSPSKGIAVGGEPTINGKIFYTTDGGNNWINGPAVNFSIRAAWAFKRNDWVLFTGTGTGPNLRVRGFDISSGSLVTLPTEVTTLPGAGSATMNDIFFHDDIAGYIVGEKGKVYRSKEFALDVNLATFPWQAQGKWDNMPANDGLNGQTQNNDLNITSVTFATRYDGFLGGDYNGTVKNYARILHDETNLFSTRFWYDKLGRIVTSQNTRQFGNNANNRKYSYTLYDYLGRVIEAGEKKENTGNDPKFASIFGSIVNNHFNPKVIDDTKLLAWLNGGGQRKEVTKSFYDEPVIINPLTQEHLRKRISSVTYSDIRNANNQIYDHATHYSYDIHGNVKTLLQDNNDPSVVALGQRYKRMDYAYDLISGNVNKVDYENGNPDQWHHKYEYDADNRIKNVKTSKDNVIYDMDAKYFYYAHGPLARTELGENKVQGCDYAYTLQGWIKGVNSNTLDSTRDIGRDGDNIPSVPSNPNTIFAADVFGYSLNYFGADYSAIDANKNTAATNFIADPSLNTNLAADAPSLFNGNINSMVTAITNPATFKPMPQLMAYKYDQLNRIMQAKAYKDIDLVQNKWNTETYASRYFNSFTYDASGNILTQKRHAEDGTAIEDMSYKYKRNPVTQQLLQNRLYHVNETVTAAAFEDDIDDMGTFDNTLLTINQNNNYSYDEEGRLIKDLQEGIANIEWMVTGKVKAVTRPVSPAFSKIVNGTPFYPSDLEFKYDALGNRIAKIEKPRNQTTGVLLPAADWKTTYYLRDAQGNVISVYKLAAPSNATSYKQIEKHIYGSSRVGMEITQTEMIAPVTSTFFTHTLGNKQYEKNNHLGNVLAVVTDKKIPVDDANYDSDGNGVNDFINPIPNSADGIVDYYKAELLVSTDYYPFGSPMPGRTFVSSDYRYGFNKMEKDDEIKGSGNSYDFGARIYDPRLGRWLAVDRSTGKYPSFSPYNFTLNNPIMFIDPDGNAVFVAFTGGATGGGDQITLTSSDAGTTGKVVLNAWATALNNNVEFSGAVFHSGATSGTSVDNAYNFIKANYTKGEDVFLYGYSYGGDFAVELAKKLEGEGITVKVLVTVDATDGPLQNMTVDTDVPSNVEVNVNFYQNKPHGESSASSSTEKSSGSSSGSSSSESSSSDSGSSNSPGSSGGPNTAQDASKTKVVNTNLSLPGVNHGNIDEKVHSTVNKIIGNVIKSSAPAPLKKDDPKQTTVD